MYWVSFVSVIAISGQYFARQAALGGDSAASLVETASADPAGSVPTAESVDNPTAGAGAGDVA